MPNLMGHRKDGAPTTCDDVCGKKRHRETKEIHGGGKKSKQRKQKQCERRLKMRLLSWKIIKYNVYDSKRMKD